MAQELDIKRFPLTPELKCPVCDNDLFIDYLSYPKINTQESLVVECYHDDTENEIDIADHPDEFEITFTLKFQFENIKIEPLKKS